MKPPIIINEHGDISFFETVQNTEQYLESIDVFNQEYIAYDSEGRLLQLNVERKKRLDRVVLSCPEMESTHILEMKQVLVNFFANIGADNDWLSKATLKELVTRGIEDHKTV